MKKFNIIDYIILITIIAVIIFAFIHIATDNDNQTSKSNYDASTMNKIVNTYLGFYRDNHIVNTTITGYNASNGKEVEISGTITWIGNDKDKNVIIRVDNKQGSYLAGLYENVPYADIYIKQASLETNNAKYNTTEFTIDPQNVTNLNDLTLNTNSTYEVSTIITSDSINGVNYGELFNSLFKIKRLSIVLTTKGTSDELNLYRASNEELILGSQILGDINGVSGPITIKVYNCTEYDKQLIESTFHVTNIKN